MQMSGVKIELPDINKAQADFIPDIANNAILYSLQAVTVVSDDLFDQIIANRPYVDVFDFYRRVKPTTAQMIGLIKAGCFDTLVGKSRQVIMEQFLEFLSTLEVPNKEKLTTVQLKKAIELHMPELACYSDGVRAYKYKAYLDKNCVGKDTAAASGKRYILNDETCIKFFNLFIKDQLKIDKEEYTYLPNNQIAIKKTALQRVIIGLMEPLMNWFNSPEGNTAYINLLRKQFIGELRQKYCSGSLSAWEMDTMNFYYSGFELEHMNDNMYGVCNFNELSVGKTSAIAGTVIDVINAKHTISLLTKHGVVDVKFYGDNYLKFNQKISKVDEISKKKVVLDDSWFKRGNKLIVFGSRREDTFVAKSCKFENYYRCAGLIEGIHTDGSLDVRYTRNKK